MAPQGPKDRVVAHSEIADGCSQSPAQSDPVSTDLSEYPGFGGGSRHQKRKKDTRKLSINGQTGNIIIIYICGSAADNQVTPPDVKSPCCLTVVILKKMGRLEERIYSINPPFSLFFSLFPFFIFIPSISVSSADLDSRPSYRTVHRGPLKV